MIFYRKDHLRECKPGEYAKVWDHRKRFTANMVCPGCHKGISISLEVHRIHEDGGVFPSFVCTHTDCTFHQNIRLDGWNV